MPDDYLDELSSEDREGLWSNALKDESRPVLVVEGEDGVVGFAALGPLFGSINGRALLDQHPPRQLGKRSRTKASRNGGG
ncbi:MAG: hypothetical protein M3P11_08225 [Actinomycetota bacterium]|nr:hypothetical protein [Actinomycetota bacterium]